MPLPGIIANILGGNLLDGVKGIIGSLKLDPTIKAQIEAALEAQKGDIMLKQMEMEENAISVVNQTMQSEAKSEHWAQWLWRPFFGFAAAFVIINNYILLPYCVRWGLQVITIPGDVWNVMLAVLGISAMTRGIEKGVSAWQSNGKSKTGGTS